jgi:endonuclease III
MPDPRYTQSARSCDLWQARSTGWKPRFLLGTEPDDTSRRLATIPGIGPITASVLIAAEK